MNLKSLFGFGKGNEATAFDTAQAKRRAAVPRESDWILVGGCEVESGKLWVGDAQIAGIEQHGALAEVPPGPYQAWVKLIAYDDDERVARMKLQLEGNEGDQGDLIGEPWADTGSLAICDFERLQAERPEDDEEFFNLIEPHIMYNDNGAICPVGSTWMFYARSGFGDGEYKLFLLKSEDGVCGAEVEMIATGTPYPF